MEKGNIYIKLLDEGTIVYRPVPASKIENDIYEVGGQEIYNSEDEVWEFTPGTLVVVNEQYLDGEYVLVATKKHK